MSVLLQICYVGLAAAALISLARIVRPGSVTDRTVALDLFIVVIVLSIAAWAAVDHERAAFFLDTGIVVAIIGFLATVTIARFIERRGAR